MRSHPRVVPALLGVLALAAPASARASSLARHVCPDGLEVVVSEMHTTPLVTVELAVRAGAMVEDERSSGLSHLAAHMFFEGNAAQPDPTAYAARLRALGMEFDGTSSDERVSLFFTTTSEHFADQMSVARDAIAAPRFDPKEVERERREIVSEIDRDASQPSYQLSRAIEAQVFWKYPTRKGAGAKRVSVLAATSDMLRTMQKRYCVPNNALLVVTGDVKADDVFAMADSLYAGWSKADDPFTQFPVPVAPPIPAPSVVLLAEPIEDFVASLVWQGPSTIGATAGDTVPLDLLAQLVGDPGSRFQRSLVDSGDCASAGLWYYPQRHTGEVGVDLEAAPDKVDACVAAIYAELPRLRSADYFTDEELRGAAHRIAIGRALDRETTLGRAHQLTFAWGMATLDYDVSYESAVAAVTRDAIAASLDRWVLGKPFVMGAMASLKQIDAGLTEERLDRLVGITPAPRKGAGK